MAMKNELSAEELRNLVEITKRVAEVKKIQAMNIAALEAAREQIRRRGQFIPKQLESGIPRISF